MTILAPIRDKPTLARDGAEHWPGILDLAGVEALRAFGGDGTIGRRLDGAALASALGLVTARVRQVLGDAAQAVRAVMFDKTPEQNWALGWHQDRTIAVRQQYDAPGFGPWTRKQGILHVAPPIEILQGMVTVRIHLDHCGNENAPLKVARGSHHLGLVAANEAAAQAEQLPLLVCTASAGDVWAYATPILHASDRAGMPSRRRVLQVDYAAFDLPHGLEWRGLG